MNSSNKTLDQIKDLVMPGRVKIRLLEEALAHERERFNQLERTLPHSLKYLQEGLVDSQARLAVMEHRIPISQMFLHEKYEQQRAKTTQMELAHTAALEKLQTELASTQNQVLEQINYVRAFEERLQGTHQAIEGQFASVQKQIAEQISYVKSLEERLHGVHSAIEKQFGSLHQQVDSVGAQLGELHRGLGSLYAQLETQVKELTELKYEVKFERNRIDYVLAAQEGILDEMEAFHRARATREYQAVFTKKNPLVSISVATANRPELLVDRCLASILRQTYQNFEVIVVGDHCIDSTAERVAALNDPRITFHNLPKRGPYPPPGRDRWCVAGSYPTNASFPLCKGDFVTHLDDDDAFYPDRLEIMVRTIQETKADILYHPYWFEEENGCWHILGNGNFESGQIGTDTIFYHRYLTRIPEDVFAYRMGEPNDWNRLRKIAMLRPHKHFVNRPLVRHYFGRNPPPFVAQEGETFSY